MSDVDYVIKTYTGSDGRHYRVRLILDQITRENPRRDYDHVCYVATVPNHRYEDIDPDAGPLDGIWRECQRRDRWRGYAAAIFERYVSIMHGGRTLYDSPHEGASAVWYILPDAPIGRPGDPDAMDEALQIERREYRAWAEGDVWGVAVEENVEYIRDDGGNGSLSQWEECDDGPVWGYFDMEDAEEVARSTFEEFLDYKGLRRPE